MKRSLSMLMGRGSLSDTSNTGSSSNLSIAPSLEFTRPVRSSVRMSQKAMGRHSSTRMPITRLSQNERNLKTSRMDNVKVTVLISELQNRIESHVIKELLDFIIDLSLDRGYKHRSLLADCVHLIDWMQASKQYKQVLHTDKTRYIKYARAYFELCKSEGVTYPMVYLNSSRKFFQKFFTSYEKEHHIPWPIAEDYLEYIRLLIVLGDFKAAAQVVDVLITRFDQDDRLPNYLFYAGVIYKELRDLERANNYFFEAAQLGPPKFFTKIEMMTVISRNLEEMSREQEITDETADYVDGEEAYRIVHQQLITEGYLEEDAEYDDWVNDAKTWIVIADKCAMHEMYSLATEFYMLALTKDPDAYKKPMLWFRFAKASFRCGRIEDAKLAMKQSLTRAPFNKQLRRTQQKWMTRELSHINLEDDEEEIPALSPTGEGLPPSSPNAAATSGTGGDLERPSYSPKQVSPVHSEERMIKESSDRFGPVDSRPHYPSQLNTPNRSRQPSFHDHHSPQQPRATVIKRASSTFGFTSALGMLHAAPPDPAEIESLHVILNSIRDHMGSEDVILAKTQALIRGNIARTHLLFGLGKQWMVKIRKLVAQTAVMVKAYHENGEPFEYPILIRVKPSWMGMIRQLYIYDLHTNRSGIVKLETPFVPMKHLLRKDHIQLSLECHKFSTHWDLESIPRFLTRDSFLTQLERNEDPLENPRNLPEREYCFLLIKFIAEDTIGTSSRVGSPMLSPANYPLVSNPTMTSNTSGQNYYYRRVLLKYDAKRKNLPTTDYKTNDTYITIIEKFNEGRVNEFIKYQQEKEREELLRLTQRTNPKNPLLRMLSDGANSAYSTARSAYSSALRSLSSASSHGEGGGEGEDLTAKILSMILEHKISLEAQAAKELIVIRTSLFRSLILRESFLDEERGEYYLLTVLNSHDVTQVIFYNIHSDQTFRFYLLREFIDCSQQLTKKWKELFDLLGTQPGIAAMIDRVTEEKEEEEVKEVDRPISEGKVPVLSALLSSPSERLHHPLDELSEFTFTVEQRYFGHVKILPKHRGVQVILLHQQHRPIIGNTFEVYEDQPTGLLVSSPHQSIRPFFGEGILPPSIETKESFSPIVEEVDPSSERNNTMQSLLLPMLMKQPSYQRELFQDSMIGSPLSPFQPQGMDPLQSISRRDPSFRFSPAPLSTELSKGLYDLQEALSGEEVEEAASASNVPSGSLTFSEDKAEALRELLSDEIREQYPPKLETVDSVSALRVGGIFDEEDSLMATAREKRISTEGGDETSRKEMTHDPLALPSYWDHSSITHGSSMITTGGGGVGESVTTAEIQSQPSLVFPPLKQSGDDQSSASSWTVSDLMQNLREQEALLEKQRQEAEAERLLQEQLRLQAEEAARQRRRRKVIHRWSTAYVTNLVVSTQRRMMSTAVVESVMKTATNAIVKQSITTFLISRTAKYLTTIGIASRSVVEILLEVLTQQAIDTIINEEIAWDILLDTFFQYFIHNLLKEITQESLVAIEEEVEEQEKIQALIEAKKEELRKKAYYPKKLRSMINEHSSYQLHRKDPSLVPINAWMEELSVFSNISPTSPTKTMSAARHRDQARSVVFRQDNSNHHNNNNHKEHNEKVRPSSSSLIPRPQTSSHVQRVANQVYETPKELVRALRSASAGAFYDLDEDRSKQSSRATSPKTIETTSVHYNSLHPPPTLPSSLLVELQTINGFDAKKRELPQFHRPMRPVSAPLPLSSTSHAMEDREIGEEDGPLLPSEGSQVRGELARPSTAAATQALAMCKDKETLYEDSLKQIRRLGFAPSSNSHAVIDLADGQPVRRPWEYLSYWQQLLSAFIKYHANLPSVKVTVKQQQQQQQLAQRQLPPSAHDPFPFTPEDSSIEEIQSLTHAYGFDEKEAFEIFKDRPTFWLLKKQLAILTRAIGPGKYHALPIHHGFAHLPKYELIKTRRVQRMASSQTTTSSHTTSNSNVANNSITNTSQVTSSPSKSRKVDNTTNRKIEEKLKKLVEREPTIEQLICCLAECRGSVGEVITKVQQLDFMKEIELVCDAINVRTLICSIATEAEGLFSPPLLAVTSTSSPSGSRSGSPGTSHRPYSPFSSQWTAGSLLPSTTTSSQVKWEDSSVLLEKIIHRRNEEIKMFNRTRNREASFTAGGGGSGGGKLGSFSRGRDGSVTSTKFVRRNSSLLLTDFESDESFVQALQKVLTKNTQMGNIQRSIAETVAEDDEEEEEESDGEGGEGRIKLRKQKKRRSQSPGKRGSVLSASTTATISETASHVPTGLMILPRVTAVGNAMTSLETESPIIRSRASFITIPRSNSNLMASQSQQFSHPGGLVSSHSSTSLIRQQSTRLSTSSMKMGTSFSEALSERPLSSSFSSTTTRRQSSASKSSFVQRLRQKQHSLIDFAEVIGRKTTPATTNNSHPPDKTVHHDQKDLESAGVVLGTKIDEESVTNMSSLMIGFPDHSIDLPNHPSSVILPGQEGSIPRSRSGSPKHHSRKPSSPTGGTTKTAATRHHSLIPRNLAGGTAYPPRRKASYHFEQYLIEEAFRTQEEAISFTVLTRRDAQKLEKEETLLKSNKLYVRQPIEKKIEHLSKHGRSPSHPKISIRGSISQPVPIEATEMVSPPVSPSTATIPRKIPFSKTSSVASMQSIDE